MTRRDVCAFALILACGCGAEPRSVSRATHSSADRPLPRDASPLLEPGAPDAPTPLANDPLWKRARSGDPMDLQRLADREAAVGLLAGVEVGRTIGLTALLALPYAEDGELALDRLCTLAMRTKGSGRHALLAAIHGVASAMAPDRERLAAESLPACVEKLGRLGSDRQLEPADRDLAGSAREVLERFVRPEP